jgi:protein TonB
MFKKIQSLTLLGVLAGLNSVTAEVRIPASEAMKAATSRPAPEYPVVARQMKVTGHVEVEVLVAADGSVENVKVVSGNPLLTPAAVNAVKKWKFTPFVSNGGPSKAVANLAFDFKP